MTPSGDVARGPSGGKRGRRLAALAAGAALLLLGLLAATGAYIHFARKQAQNAWEMRLTAMAEDRVRGIQAWLGERRGDALTVSKNGDVVFLLVPPPAGGSAADRETTRREVEVILTHVVEDYSYLDAYVLDGFGNGQARSRGSPPLGEACISRAMITKTAGTPGMEDFHRDERGRVTLSFQAPVYPAPAGAGNAGASRRPLGVVVLVADPARQLYPLLSREPTYTNSGETLLVEKQGDEIVTLTPLRQSKAPPLARLAAFGQPRLAARSAVLGISAVGRFTDYRGVPVLAATRPIQGTPWGLVVKVDEEEAMASFRRQRLLAVLVLAALLAGAAALFLAFRRGAKIDELQGRALRDERYRLLSAEATDIILFASPEGNILEANAMAEKVYGHSQREFLRLNLRDLRVPETLPEFDAHLRELSASGSLRYETLHRRRDGAAFPVEVSARATTLGGAPILFSVVRDTSERRAGRAALEESERLYRSLFENMLNGFAYCRMIFEGGRPVDFVYLSVNAAFDRQTGLGAVAGRRISEVVPGIAEQDPDLIERYGRVASTGEPEVFETYVESLKQWFSISAYCPQKGYFVAVFDVITERKRAEEELRRSRENFRRAFVSSPAALAITGLSDGKFRIVNNAYTEVMGYEPHEIIGRTTTELNTYVDAGERERLVRRLRKDNALRGFDLRVRHKSGEERSLILSMERIVYDGEDCILSTFLDQTERRRAEAALEESRELLTCVVEGTSNPIYVKDLQGRYLLFNSAAARVVGVPADRVLGHDDRRIFPPGEARTVMEGDRGVMLSGETRTYEEQVTGADGRLYHFLSTKGPRRDPQGRVIGLWGIAHDITKRVEAESALRESEASLHLALKAAQAGSWEWDLRTGANRWSEELWRLYGLEPFSLEPSYETWRQSVHPADRTAAERAVRGAVETGSELDAEWRVVRPDGSERWLLSRGKPVRNDAGEVDRFTGIVVDITERRRAEEEVRAARAFLDRIIDYSPFAMWLSDPKGTVMRVNRALCKTINLPEEAIVEKYNVLEDKNLEVEGVLPAVRGVFEKLEPARFTIPWRAAEAGDVQFKGARDMHIDVSMFPLLDEKGHLIDVVCQWVDITARKRAEEALQESEAKLREAHAMAQLGYWTWDVRTGGVEWSEEVFKIFQLEPGEFKPQIDSILALSPWPDDHARDKDLIRKAMESREKGIYEQRFLRPDGSIGHYQSTFQGKYDGAGNLVSIVGTVQDITERKRVERSQAIRNQVAQVCLTVPDEDLYSEVMAVILQVTESPYGVFGYLDQAGALVVPTMTRDIWDQCQMPEKSIVFPRETWGDSIWPRAIRQKQLLFSNEPSTVVPQGHVPITRNVTVPIVYRGEAIGLLQVANKREPYTDEDIRTMEDIAAYLGPVLDARLNRDRQEAALQESERRYHDVLENMIEGCQIIGFDWTYHYVNESTCQQGKKSKEELIGRTMMDCYPGIERTEMFSVLGRCMAERVSAHLENEFHYGDGTNGWFELSIQPVPEGLFILSNEITARKRAAEALAQSEERFRMLVESAPEGIFLQAEGRFRYLNSAALRLFGASSAEELLGHSIPERFHPVFMDIVRERIRILNVEKRQLPPLEERALRLDGSEVDVEVAGVPFRVGSSDGALVFIRDITDRKRAEEEILRLNAELEARVAQRTAQLEAANRELESFSYSVSHDLRSPLRGIDGWSLALLEDCRDKLSESEQEYLATIRGETQRMGQLIDAMLDLSRTARALMRRERVDLSGITADLSAELLRQEPGRHADFAIEPGLAADGDPALLRTALQNLLGNAWKYTAKNGRTRIEFGALRPGNQTGANEPDAAPIQSPVFFVRDNGVGFDMAFAHKLFAPFQRLHSREEYPGTGIGLATVQRIVHRHGGAVWAEGEKGKGAIFYFTLGS